MRKGGDTMIFFIACKYECIRDLFDLLLQMFQYILTFNYPTFDILNCNPLITNIHKFYYIYTPIYPVLCFQVSPSWWCLSHWHRIWQHNNVPYWILLVTWPFDIWTIWILYLPTHYTLHMFSYWWVSELWVVLFIPFLA